MKKIVFSLVLLLGASCIAFAQDEIKVLKVDTLKPAQETCRALPLSHWSIAIKGGLNNFLLSPPAPTYADRFNLSYGGGLEYTFNPFVGLGLEYTYSDYSRPYTYNGTIGSLEGATNDIMLIGSVNLSNVFSPLRGGFWKNWNIYGNVGAGAAMFKGNLDGASASNQTALAGMLGLNVELNLSRSFSMSLEGKYHQYDALYMSEGSRSNRNGDALMLLLGLRYKMGAGVKKHARNCYVRDYSPEPQPIIVRKTVQRGDTEAVIVRLKTAENVNTVLRDRLQKLEQEAQKTGK